MGNLFYFLCLGAIFGQMLQGFKTFDSKPYLTPTKSPTNSININWNTRSLKSTIVAYGLTPSLKDTAILKGLSCYHHLRLTNLLPKNMYYYRILPNGGLKRFKTFPVYADSFTFIAFGDTRSDSVTHQSIINRMANYEFDFLLHTGDFIIRGDDFSAWSTFFNIEDTILQEKQFLPAIGNHEYPYWIYDTLFALPDAEYFYSVNYGNAHFIMLDTQMELYGAQRNWLRNDLITTANDTLIDWIFVNLHRPPYSSGSHGSQMDVREAFCPLFEQYGVDIVFCGHDHDYERTREINGVTYIVTGGGGAPLYDIDSSPWTVASEKTYHFCLIELKGKKLFLKAIKPEGVVFDTLRLDKHNY
jgi:hypothetical protein